MSPRDNYGSGIHATQLDAAGTWPHAMETLRSRLPNAFAIGHAQNAEKWVRGNQVRSDRYMPVTIGFVGHFSGSWNPNQMPIQQTNQQSTALITALQHALSQLYVSSDRIGGA